MAKVKGVLQLWVNLREYSSYGVKLREFSSYG
jgi:hypothetical protein